MNSAFNSAHLITQRLKSEKQVSQKIGQMGNRGEWVKTRWWQQPWPDAFQMCLQFVSIHCHFLALLGWWCWDHLELQVVIHLVRLGPGWWRALSPTAQSWPQWTEGTAPFTSLPVLHHPVVRVHVLIAVFFLLLLDGLLWQVDQVSWEEETEEVSCCYYSWWPDFTAELHSQPNAIPYPSCVKHVTGYIKSPAKQNPSIHNYLLLFFKFKCHTIENQIET